MFNKFSKIFLNKTLFNFRVYDFNKNSVVHNLEGNIIKKKV